MKLTVGLYGLFLLLVAVRGNGGKLATQLTGDMGGFLPWLIVAAVLGGLYEFEPTHDIAAWFIALVLLSFALKNIDNIKSTFGQIYTNSVTPASTAPSNLSLSGGL